MTYEEAIIDIRENIQPIVGGKSLDIAISAIEKQIPKKPNIYSKFERHCECGAMVKTYQNYCYDCGQALKWRDTE